MIETLLLAASLGCGGTPMNQQLAPSRSRDRAPEIDTLGVSSFVRHPAGRVWLVLPAVFKDLGLDLNYRVPEEHRTGTCYQKVRSRLGRALLSDLMDCGETRSLPNADRYEIALTVIVTLEAQGDGTAVHTFVLGVGLDDSGVGGSRIWCYSKGVLEQRISDMIQAQLAAG
jgi:hypothetical protein